MLRTGTVFEDKDIYLLDDPLSAVDVHVARHLFSHCIRQALKYKTRVLCTHQIQYAQQADYIILVDNGRILRAGDETSFFHREDRQSRLNSVLKENLRKFWHPLNCYSHQRINPLRRASPRRTNQRQRTTSSLWKLKTLYRQMPKRDVQVREMHVTQAR